MSLCAGRGRRGPLGFGVNLTVGVTIATVSDVAIDLTGGAVFYTTRGVVFYATFDAEFVATRPVLFPQPGELGAEIIHQKSIVAEEDILIVAVQAWIAPV